MFFERSKKLQHRKRYHSSLSDNKNSVAEHSWRLALMVFVLAKVSNLEINIERAIGLALVHDLAEIGTADIDATDQIGREDIQAHKHVMEYEAIRELASGLSFGDWLLELWDEFEAQVSIEAKFVKALDKIEGFLHIAEVGVTYYTPKKFNTAYADKAVAAFDAACADCPELAGLLTAIKDDLKQQFSRTDVELIHT